MTDRFPLIAPLKYSAFAVLWVGVAAAFLSQWMLPVTAQWFLLSLPGAAPLVPLVQVAISLPMALIAIPAGVLADAVDRRLLVIVVQSGALAAECALVALTVTGRLTPGIMLVLLAALACSIVLTYTPFNSMIPDIVPRESISSATALLAIATNATRIIGPAVAGVVITVGGVAAGFSAAIPPTLLLLVSMLRWRGKRTHATSRERFMPAVWSGLRFVRHSPQALKITVRGLWFTTGVIGLFSLLPLIAKDLGAGSAGLGFLFAAQGIGAVLGALTIPYLRRRISANALVALGFAAASLGLLVAALTANLLVIGVANVLAGWAWTSALATLQAGMQLYLPAWVRARGIAALLVATYGGQALGSFVLGLIATRTSAPIGLVVGAFILAAGAALAVWWPLKDLDDLDRSTVRGWTSPELLVDPQEIGGEVQVRVSYTVDDRHLDRFLEVMHLMRRVRLRNGATRWQLLRHAEVEGRYIEEFMVGSWGEYEQQMVERLIESDRVLAEGAAALSSTPVENHYLIQLETYRA